MTPPDARPARPRVAVSQRPARDGERPALIAFALKVGDHVLAGGVEGTVRAIGLFTTSIDSPDNLPTSVGNAAVMGGTLKNLSHNPIAAWSSPRSSTTPSIRTTRSAA